MQSRMLRRASEVLSSEIRAETGAKAPFRQPMRCPIVQSRMLTTQKFLICPGRGFRIRAEPGFKDSLDPESFQSAGQESGASFAFPIFLFGTALLPCGGAEGGKILQLSASFRKGS